MDSKAFKIKIYYNIPLVAQSGLQLWWVHGSGPELMDRIKLQQKYEKNELFKKNDHNIQKMLRHGISTFR